MDPSGRGRATGPPTIRRRRVPRVPEADDEDEALAMFERAFSEFEGEGAVDASDVAIDGRPPRASRRRTSCWPSRRNGLIGSAFLVDADEIYPGGQARGRTGAPTSWDRPRAAPDGVRAVVRPGAHVDEPERRLSDRRPLVLRADEMHIHRSFNRLPSTCAQRARGIRPREGVTPLRSPGVPLRRSGRPPRLSLPRGSAQSCAAMKAAYFDCLRQVRWKPVGGEPRRMVPAVVEPVHQHGVLVGVARTRRGARS